MSESKTMLVSILPSRGVRITAIGGGDGGVTSIESVSIGDPKEVTSLYYLLADVIEYYETT